MLYQLSYVRNRRERYRPTTTLDGPVKRSAVPITVAVLAVALIALLVYGVVGKKADHSLDQAVSAGKKPAAPGLDVSLPNLDGAGQHAPRGPARQGRRAQLLGLVVRAVQGRGAGAGARPAAPEAERRHRVRRDLQGRPRRLARLRPAGEGDLARTCATTA